MRSLAVKALQGKRKRVIQSTTNLTFTLCMQGVEAASLQDTTARRIAKMLGILVTKKNAQPFVLVLLAYFLRQSGWLLVCSGGKRGAQLDEWH